MGFLRCESRKWFEYTYESFRALIPYGKPKSNDNVESIKEIERKRNGG